MIRILGILVALVIAFLLAISLLGPGDWGNRNSDERARRELKQRHSELVTIVDFYPLLSQEFYGRDDTFPPSVMDSLKLFLKSNLKYVEHLVPVQRELLTRKNPYTGRPGLQLQYADYVEYIKAADKRDFRGFLIYQPLECKHVKKSPKGSAPEQSCEHYNIYATGQQGQLINKISR
jgi:hypothetical protein